MLPVWLSSCLGRCGAHACVARVCLVSVTGALTCPACQRARLVRVLLCVLVGMCLAYAGLHLLDMVGGCLGR